MGFLKNIFNRKLAPFIKKEIARAGMDNNLAGANVHPTARVLGSVIHGSVNVGEHAAITHCTIAGNQIDIGRYTSINGPNTFLYSEIHYISIGNFCSIARNVDIQEWNHPMNNLSTSLINSGYLGINVREDMRSKGPIIIGHDVWIGTQSVVLSGVTIGNGAIIAANSTVSADVPPYAIVAGNPAKIIKFRFDPETIKLITALEWWNWDMEKIKRNRELFNTNITEDFLRTHGVYA